VQGNVGAASTVTGYTGPTGQTGPGFSTIQNPSITRVLTCVNSNTANAESQLLFVSGTPGGSLVVSGSISATTLSVASGFLLVNSSGLLTTGSGSNQVGGVTLSNGYVTATDVTVTSDERAKTNIGTIANPTETINLLRGVYYNRIGESVRKIGLIAQEVEPILPEVVLNGELKSVAYGNIVALLIEGFKELSHRVSLLEAAQRT
jgi:hypothetical protein